MKHSALLSICLFITFLTFYGQDTTILKRKAYKLSMEVDKNTVYEENLEATPYVHQNNTLQIYPGEDVFIEVEQVNGVVKSFTAVKENKHKEKTLQVSFKQVVENGAHKSMMLTVNNPFPQKLVYKAMIFLLKNKKWVETDVYPVEPGLAGIEIWPELITTIGLAGWEFEMK